VEANGNGLEFKPEDTGEDGQRASAREGQSSKMLSGYRRRRATVGGEAGPGRRRGATEGRKHVERHFARHPHRPPSQWPARGMGCVPRFTG
jgi:hypothetical protein